MARCLLRMGLQNHLKTLLNKGRSCNNTERPETKGVNYYLVQSKDRGLIVSDYTCALKHLTGTNRKALAMNKAKPVVIAVSEEDVKKARKGVGDITGLLIYGSNGNQWNQSVNKKDAHACTRVTLRPKGRILSDKRSMRHQ